MIRLLIVYVDVSLFLIPFIRIILPLKVVVLLKENPFLYVWLFDYLRIKLGSYHTKRTFIAKIFFFNKEPPNK